MLKLSTYVPLVPLESLTATPVHRDLRLGEGQGAKREPERDFIPKRTTSGTPKLHHKQTSGK